MIVECRIDGPLGIAGAFTLARRRDLAIGGGPAAHCGNLRPPNNAALSSGVSPSPAPVPKSTFLPTLQHLFPTQSIPSFRVVEVLVSTCSPEVMYKASAHQRPPGKAAARCLVETHGPSPIHPSWETDKMVVVWEQEQMMKRTLSGLRGSVEIY